MKNKRGYYDMFIQTCAKWPSNIAVRNYNHGKYETYTYSELYGVCEYISQNLQQLQCPRGIIGMVSKRNVLIPCSIAAAHKCSTAFMFLDPSKDINTILDSFQFKTVMVFGEENKKFEESNRKADKTIIIFNVKINFYVIDNMKMNSSFCFPDYSFIAMTSGSTGEPKHIQVPLQCIQPNVTDLTKLFKITPNDIIYFSTPLTFDPSMIEILLACENGASLLIAPEHADVLFPDNKLNAITFWQTTPSKFFQFPYSVILNKILCTNSNLKVLAFGGEPLNGVKRLRELKMKENNTQLFTLYGVTEMSCWACLAELDLDRHLNDYDIPLGNCLSETEIQIKPSSEDKNLGNIVLVSQTRKCVILNKPKINEESSSLKCVDTGDLGEIKNGRVYYRGRRDDVIKRFGQKVNMQFIEIIVMQCPNINSCSCIWLPKPMLLVVYYSSEKVTSQELADFLKAKLEHSYLPDKVIRVESLPINEHGKVSKQILIKLFENSLHENVSKESFKAIFMKELRDSLNVNITYDDIKDKNFFAIGGTSFLAVTFCNRLSHECSEIAKVILPYLLSHKYTIAKIIRMAQKVNLVHNVPKAKLRAKRPRSLVESCTDCSSHKKPSVSETKALLHSSQAWAYDTGKCVDASPTAFESKGHVYVTVGSHSGRIVSVEAFSGKVKGLVQLSSRIEASVYCYNNLLQEPYGVVGTYDGTVVCYSLETSKVAWQINVKSMIKSKAVCWKDNLYIASYDGNVRCLDIKNGRIISIIHVTNQAISADLILAKEYILTGTLSGVCASLHTQTNSIIWRETMNSPVFSSPVLYDNDKYVIFTEVNGKIHCRTVEKGIKLWDFDGAKGNIFSTPYIKRKDKNNWQMMFGCHDNNVYSVDINNHQTNLGWTFDMGTAVYATPSYMGNYIVAISTKGRLVYLNPENGTSVHEYLFPGEIFSSPAVCRSYLFVGCRNDKLYALKSCINS